MSSRPSLSRRWDPRDFLDRLTPLLDALHDDPVVMISLSRRVSEACRAQASEARDRFREIEVHAACLVALLPYADHADVADFLDRQGAELGLLVEAALQDVADAIREYQYALVAGGLSDLYYLPIRLSKLLGWAGFAVHARELTGREIGPARTVFTRFLERMFETYSLSLVAMSDCQAPFLLSAVTALARANLAEEAERLLGHYFSTVVACGGKIARPDLAPSKVLSYLLARSSPGSEFKLDLIAQPTEFVLVLLRLSRLIGLDDEFDLALAELDHLALNAYLPEDYRRFADEHIASGFNAVFHVGHDFWRVADLEVAWPAFALPSHSGMALASILASLVFPDRSPWFLIPVKVDSGDGAQNSSK